MWGVPNTSEPGVKSEVANKWDWWLHNSCRLGGPQRSRAGDKNRSGPQMGLVATEPLPSRGSPTLDYITPATWGVPNPSEPGTKSEVAHKWA